MSTKIVRTKTPGEAWGTSIEPDEGGGSQPGAAILYGPLTVLYSDVPTDGSKHTLFVAGDPDRPAVGDHVIRVYIDPTTAVDWDNQESNPSYLYVAQSVASNNYWSYATTRDLVDEDGGGMIPTIGNGNLGGLSYLGGIPLVAGPVEVYFDNSAGNSPATQGRADYYVVAATPVA